MPKTFALNNFHHLYRYYKVDQDGDGAMLNLCY